MACLQSYYDDHAAQARQHEKQREVVTNVVLGVAGLLIGMVTLGNMAIWSLPAAMAVAALGAYGLLISGKHYERFNFHTSLMKAIREEMDRIAAAEGVTPKPFSELHSQVEREHYFGFTWPKFRATRKKPQAIATSWVARQRMHMFWDAAHAGIAILGLMLCLFIVVKAAVPVAKEPFRVELTKGAGT
jgi:hypothetical protein